MKKETKESIVFILFISSFILFTFLASIGLIALFIGLVIFLIVLPIAFYYSIRIHESGASLRKEKREQFKKKHPHKNR